MPHATFCVPCLQFSGDVPVLKRFDEITGDNERVEVYFTEDQRIERQLHYSNLVVADEDSFNTVIGDDSHLTKEIDQVLGVARSMDTAFESDTAEEIVAQYPLRLRAKARSRAAFDRGLPVPIAA
jgi:hypothetical protein